MTEAAHLRLQRSLDVCPAKFPMHPEIAHRLAAIGPYTVVADEDGGLLIRWSDLPSISPFGLVFDAHSLGLVGRCHPHGRMFDLWEVWQARHTEFAAEIAVAVELEAEAAGVAASPSDAWVVVTQVEDGPNCCYYTVGAHVRVGDRQVVCELNERTGQLKYV